VRVGIDARLLARHNAATGVGLYVEGLIQALAKLRHIELKLYTDRSLPEGQWTRAVRVVSHIAGVPWQQVRVPLALLQDSVNVFHSPTFTLPLAAPCPAVVTIHDLAILRYPELSETANRRYLSRLMPPSIRRADAIITMSDFVRNELCEHFGVRASKVFTVPPGIDHDLWRPAPPEVVRRTLDHMGLQEPYLIFVGTREPRKNLVRLVQAFSLVTRGFPRLRLLLVGKQGFPSPFQTSLEQAIAATPGVDVLPYAPRESLPLLVQGSLGLCYVSVYEGFGVPIIEALALGTPVVTSIGTAMEETTKGVAELVDPFDVESIAWGIQRMLSRSDPDRRLQGIERARFYRWERAALKTADIYGQVG